MGTDNGLSSIFGANKIVVGGVALAAAAVAGAVAAANESPSVNSTFKVTGKTPKEYLDSNDKDANRSSTPKKTIRIPQPEKRKSQTSPVAPQTSSSPGSKEALREELAKQRANINMQAAEKAARESTVGDTPSLPSPKVDKTSSDISNTESMDDTEPAFVPPPAKNSFSPFRGGKPKAATNDFLYSPPSCNFRQTMLAEKHPRTNKSPHLPKYLLQSRSQTKEYFLPHFKKNPTLRSEEASLRLPSAPPY